MKSQKVQQGAHHGETDIRGKAGVNKTRDKSLLKEEGERKGLWAYRQQTL